MSNQNVSETNTVQVQGRKALNSLLLKHGYILNDRNAVLLEAEGYGNAYNAFKHTAMINQFEDGDYLVEFVACFVG